TPNRVWPRVRRDLQRNRRGRILRGPRSLHPRRGLVAAREFGASLVGRHRRSCGLCRPDGPFPPVQSDVLPALRALGPGHVLESARPSRPLVAASQHIAGDRVYAATNDGNGTVYSWRLSALGSGEWALQPGPPDYLLSSPVVHEGALYIASDNGRLYRLADV